jgi:hypothetical protein
MDRRDHADDYDDDDHDWEYPEPDEDDEEGEAEFAECPKCGADVYEESERCPLCGEYMTPHYRTAFSPSSPLMVWGMILALIVAIGGCVWFVW